MGGVRTRLFGPPPSCMRCVAIVSFSFAGLHGMDSSIDESDLGSLSRRRTSLEVEREGNRSRSPSVCLLLAAFIVHPALRRLQIKLLVSKHLNWGLGRKAQTALRSPGELDGNETEGVIYGAFELPLSVGIVESLLQLLGDFLFSTQHRVGTTPCKLRVDQYEALASLPARAPSRRPATPFELS